MKHFQSGFSVIEMIIGILLSAILMTASLTIYNQISKGGIIVERITHTDTQIMILHNRLVADLQGLCPLWFTKEHYEKLKVGTKDTQQTPINNKSTQKQNNFLYAQSNDQQFDLLTFVTTNALQVYGDTPVRTVRIVYLLQPESTDLKTFKLMRKEDSMISGEFDLEKLKSGKFEQIANKITQCAIEYGFIESKGKKADTQHSSDKPFEFKFVSKWGGATETEREDEKIPKLPDILKLTLKIQTSNNQEAKSYELFCTIPTSHASAIKSFAEQRQESNKKQPESIPKAQGQTPNSESENPKIADGVRSDQPKNSLPGTVS